MRFLMKTKGVLAQIQLAMTVTEMRDSGLLGLDLDIHVEDFVNLVSGFRPPKPTRFEPNQPEFNSPFDTVREEFPSAELLRDHIKAIDLALFTTVNAVEVMSERPGMPVPTFEQLAIGCIEMARLKGFQRVVETAASSDLSSNAAADVDLFGVGPVAAPIINHIVPPRCVPGKGRITLPSRPAWTMSSQLIF